MTYRRARLHEAEAIAALAAQISGAPHWTVAVYRDLAVNPLRLLLVAEDAGHLVAYAAAALTPPMPFEAELEAIAVQPAHQRRGLGRALLQHVQQWTLQQQALPLRLEVRASNSDAEQLYRTAGFLPCGRRPRYYRDPEEDALLMQWTNDNSDLVSTTDLPPTSGIIKGDYGS